MLYEETWDLCLACALERSRLSNHNQEYEPGDAAWEADCRERLREITEARNRENEADDARMIREMLKGR